MTLAERAAPAVSETVRARGLQDFKAGLVEIPEGGARRVMARVLPRPFAKVKLEVPVATIGALGFSCSCDDGLRDLVCRHVWATILSVSATGLMRVVGQGPVRLQPVGSPGRPSPPPEPPASLDAEQPGHAGEGQGLPAEGGPPSWETMLAALRAPAGRSNRTRTAGDLHYVVDLELSRARGSLVVEAARFEAPTKRWPDGRYARTAVTRDVVESATGTDDGTILAALTGARDVSPLASTGRGASQYAYGGTGQSFALPVSLEALVLPLMCGTGRCRLAAGQAEKRPLQWDDGEPWEVRLRVGKMRRHPRDWAVTGVLRRGAREVPLESVGLLLEHGTVIIDGVIGRFDGAEGGRWASLLHKSGPFHVEGSQRRSFLAGYHSMPDAPPLELPTDWSLSAEQVTPEPRLRVSLPGESAEGRLLVAELSFAYGGLVVAAGAPGTHAFDAERWRLFRRDAGAEEAAEDRLRELHVCDAGTVVRALCPSARLQLTIKSLPHVTRTLCHEGWHVEATGKIYRKPAAFQVKVSSSIDWFELSGSVDYEVGSAKLVDLLAALRKGESTVVLDDGTLGVLPEEWLERFGLLARLGDSANGRVRFRPSQAGLVDAFLSGAGQVEADAAFERARAQIARGARPEPRDPSAAFRGALRGYQREGLGWLAFHERTGFGACLADDMGLGKTVQVLAHLASRRPKGSRPSLVVAPRSVLPNWRAEAARFAPGLRVLEHVGEGRVATDRHLASFDLVLTTYGTLRRDAAALADIRFDYVVLDEAQAIKNADSDTAKAAQKLVADHRLALSGTPVENHLGELWSLFEFLNPGVLGRASVFRQLASSGGGEDSPELLALVARALRPFLLRRTKTEVAPDLPERNEATLVVELEGRQRALYDELAAHYRERLLGKVQREGLGRSKLMVLEALLRLRQVACHPALVDPKLEGATSAKLDALFAELPALREKGHKALVFSQFTSFLSMVRARLDEDQVPYEYLDGQTKNRAQRVERFQTDPDCPLFLISLKAGGLGLNLTAAEYVFLLDPWWNPAVEAQAIDRAHRIGQTRPVFAYRLLAKDTIEERIAQLQGRKRALADSLIEGDGAMIRELTVEDLTLLLS